MYERKIFVNFMWYMKICMNIDKKKIRMKKKIRQNGWIRREIKREREEVKSLRCYLNLKFSVTCPKIGHRYTRI